MEWDGLVDDDIVIEFTMRVVNETDDDIEQERWREKIVDIQTYNRTPIHEERPDYEDKSAVAGYDATNPSQPLRRPAPRLAKHPRRPRPR